VPRANVADILLDLAANLDRSVSGFLVTPDSTNDSPPAPVRQCGRSVGITTMPISSSHRPLPAVSASRSSTIWPAAGWDVIAGVRTETDAAAINRG